MAKQSVSVNGLSFKLIVRIDARNCYQIMIRLIAGIAATAMFANRIMNFFESAIH